MKLAKGISLLLLIGVLAYIGLAHVVCLDVPAAQKLADCGSKNLNFTMACEHYRPYALVLGLPKSETNPVILKGEMRFKDTSGAVLRLPIGSDDMVRCSWLDAKAGLQGYILTWRTNRSVRLDEFLHNGKTYDVEVVFAERPPESSSIWLTSMARAKLW
jgi:hypothetical protein